MQHFIARVVALVLVPVSFYVFIFYVHLTILSRASPHAAVMTSAFQASLEVTSL